MKKVIFLCILAFQLTVFAADEAVIAKETKETKETATLKKDQPASDKKDETGKLNPNPEEGLHDKKLSKATENFVPSEQISADNAVPFPVDI